MDNEILKDILTKMYYDSSKTLNENVIPIPKLLTERIIYPTEKQLAFNQYTFGRRDGTTCSGEGMFGFCEYGYCNIQMPKMCETPGNFIGIGDLFGDGYYYYRWCGDNKQWVWVRVAKKDNQISKDFSPVKKMDIYTGTMDYPANCSTQQCRDVLNQKLNPWVAYVTKTLKQKCEPVFNAESNIAKLNTSKVLKYGDKDSVLGLPYVYRLQQVLRNLAELDGITLGMGIDGDFGNNTLNAVKQLFKKNAISIKEVEEKIKTATGGAVAPYPEYFQNIGAMKRKGWINVTCPKCTSSFSHYNYCAFKEIDRINAEITKIIPYRDCQSITIQKGSSGLEIPNYSVINTYTIISKKERIRTDQGNDPFMNKSVLGAGVATAEQLKQIEENQVRPYFTYWFLRDFYFDIPEIQPTNKDGNFFNKSVWPDGPYEFMRTFYQTDDYNSIMSLINAFRKYMVATNCTHMRAPEGQRVTPNMDVHDFMTVVEIGSLILGMIPSPLSPLLLGISTTAGLTDAVLYYADGDPYMGTMMLALEVIPGGELISVLKKGKVAGKLGKEGAQELMQKAARNQLDQVGQQTYKNLQQEFTGSLGKELVQKAEKEVLENGTKRMTSNFLKLPFKQQLKAFSTMVELCWNTLGTLPKILIRTSVATYSLDKLYVAINGRDESRQNSDIRRLYYMIRGYEGMTPEEYDAREKQIELSIQMGSAMTEMEQKMKQAPKNLVKLGIKVTSEGTFNKNALLQYCTQRANETSTVRTPSGVAVESLDLKTPPIEQVENGSGFYSYGMTGDTIGQLKNILKRNWGIVFSETGLDISKLNGSSNLFDEDFELAIRHFQTKIAPKYLKEKLYAEEGGTIGSKTLKAIRKISEGQKINIDRVDIEKDKYNYFYYDSFDKNWVTITYDQYKELKDQGLKNEIKAERKTSEPFLRSNTPPTELKTLQPKGEPLRPRRRIFR
jgi:hypothetical protein